MNRERVRTVCRVQNASTDDDATSCPGTWRDVIAPAVGAGSQAASPTNAVAVSREAVVQGFLLRRSRYMLESPLYSVLLLMLC